MTRMYLTKSATDDTKAVEPNRLSTILPLLVVIAHHPCLHRSPMSWYFPMSECFPIPTQANPTRIRDESHRASIPIDPWLHATTSMYMHAMLESVLVVVVQQEALTQSFSVQGSMISVSCSLDFEEG